MMQKLTILLYCLILVSNHLISQNTNQLVSVTGATLTNQQIQLSFSIGEPAIETFGSNSILLTQGFYQPDILISSTTAFHNPQNWNVFPVPCDLELFVQGEWEINGFQTVRIHLHDQLGRVLWFQQPTIVKNEIYTIPMNNIPPGIYLLTIHANDDTWSSYHKIIKL